MELTVTTAEKKPVKYLRAMCDVPYWEDAEINGEPDAENEPRIPCRVGSSWAPTIELETGKISDWPEGVVADVHYKVCDAGTYELCDSDMNRVALIDGCYVPAMMSPGGEGFGDYVIMKIGPDGQIENWKADLSPFEKDNEI